ncbi:MAG: MFS transporter [Cyclobacteriaceae bacterium]|nr:MFS transporter [Cyclobacteriaceae bacterium]
MNYLVLLGRYPHYLSFGFIHYYFSFLGQTFFLSVFVGSLTEYLGITNEGFSLVYAAATLSGAFLLPFLGALLDRVKLRDFSLVNGVALACFCYLMAYVQDRFFMYLCLLGLRLTGQGLMPLIGSISIGRYFTENRGKSLSLASMGLSLSETIMPGIAILLISTLGWQMAFQIMAIALICIHLPLVWFLVKKNDPFQRVIIQRESLNVPVLGKTRREVIRDKDFYFLLASAVTIPFLITGLFIHHNLLAQIKGWTMEWIATSFIFYGLFKIAITFLAGPLVDRFSARQVFPFHMVPMIIGVFILIPGNHPVFAAIYLSLAGICTSLASVSSTAMWAEIYGYRNLGSIKSLTTTAMVLVSAAGPVIIGVFLASKSWWWLGLLINIITMSVLSLTSYFILKRKRIYTENP